MTPPTREFEARADPLVAGREVRLIEVGPAHTPGDLIVHVPVRHRVPRTCCSSIGADHVGRADGRLVAALDGILELNPDVVVPGHGPVSDQSEVEVLRAYLEWVDAQALPRLAAGGTVPEVARELLRSDEYRSAPWDWWDSPSGS